MTSTAAFWPTTSVRSVSAMTATFRSTITRDGTSLRSTSGAPHLQKAIEYIRGRTLDIGCGAGRIALPLQRNGVDVVGIDQSPLAVRICRERGINDVRLLPVTRVSANKLGVFDSIVMMGNNFGCSGVRSGHAGSYDAFTG